MVGAERTSRMAAAQFFMIAFASVAAPYHLMLSASSAILLTGQGAEMLPWVYLGVAILSPAVLYALWRARRRMTFGEIMLWALFGRILVAVVLKGALAMDWSVAPLAASIWARVDFMVGGSLLVAFGRIYFGNTRQLAVALSFTVPFGLVLGGALIPLALTTIAVEDLFVLAALALAGAVPPMLTAEGVQKRSRTTRHNAVTRPLSGSFRRYIVVVMALMAAAAMVHHVLDAVFLTATQGVLPDSYSIALTVSLALAGGGALAFIFRQVVQWSLFQRTGLAGTLALSPLLLLVIAGFGWLLQTGESGGWIWFGALAAMKATEIAITLSVWRPSFSDLFRMIPEPQDRRTQLVADWFAYPAGGAIAALALWLLAGPTLRALAPVAAPDPAAASTATAAAADATLVTVSPLALVFFAACAFWLLVTMGTALVYRRMMVNALARNQSFQTGAGSAGADTRARQMIQRRLASDDPDEVVGAARLQAALDPRGFINSVPRLIARGDTATVRRLLETVESAQRPELFPPMAGRLTVEEDVGLRDALLTSAAATGHSSSPRLLASALADAPNAPPIGALVGLGRHGGQFGVAVAAQFLERYAKRGDDALRLTLEAVAQIGPGAPPGPVAEGLRSNDPKLRQMAIRAAARCADASLAPLLIARLHERRERRAAMQALSLAGPGAIPALASAIGDRSLPEPVREAAVTALGGINTPAAREQLFHHIESRSLNLRAAVHLALWRMGAVAPREYAEGLANRSRQMMQNGAEAMLAQCELVPLGNRLLLDSLALRSEKSVRRAIRAVGLTRKRRKADRQLSSLFRAQEGNETALSLAKTLLPADQAKLTEYLGDTSASTASALRTHLGQSARTPEAWLSYIVTDAAWATDWLRALALDEIARREPETAITLAATLEEPGPQLAEFIAALTARHAPPETEATEGPKTMSLTIIEKVLILKSVDLFHQVPDEDLADIAPYLSSIYFDKGDKVMRRGDIGNELYVIVGGEVDVLRADGEVVRLGEKSVFGDLAALDPEPRVADIVAATPTHVLALSNDQLLSLFESNAEIAAGVISALVRRLRNAEKY